MTKVSERESRRALNSESRAKLLDVLRAVGWPVTVGEAAGAVGVHTNSARSDLDLLVSVGQAAVLTQEQTQPGRPKVLYRAAPEPASPIAADYYRGFASLLAEGLAATSDPVQAAFGAGERWAPSVDRRPPGWPTWSASQSARSPASTASTARRTPCVHPGRRGAAGSGSTRDGGCGQLTAHRPW